MLKVGLTGGLACGKSFVGEVLRDYGCLVIQADELGHAVLAPGGEAYDDVVREFGSGILDAAGRIERRALAAQVFGAPGRLATLNSLVHPPVFRREDLLLTEFAAREPQGIAVVEAAIMIETGSYRRYDRIVLVVCGEEQQRERALRRDGASESDVSARLSRQMPLEEKRKHAHFVIDTSGEKEETVRQTGVVFQELRRIEA